MDQINPQYTSALSKAAALCSAGEKCEWDIRQKLEQWNVDEEMADKVIEALIKDKFIDHNRYTPFFVRDKLKFNKWGKRKICYELTRKKIERNIIEEAIAQIDQEEYIEELVEILKIKNRQIKGKDAWQTKAALMRYGMSKGFEGDDVNRAMSRIVKQPDEDE